MGNLRNKNLFEVSYITRNIKNEEYVGSYSKLVMTDTVDNAMEAVLQYWGEKLYIIEIIDVKTKDVLIYKDDTRFIVSNLKRKRENLDRKRKKAEKERLEDLTSISTLDHPF